jgi:hypothetical protein
LEYFDQIIQQIDHCILSVDKEIAAGSRLPDDASNSASSSGGRAQSWWSNVMRWLVSFRGEVQETAEDVRWELRGLAQNIESNARYGSIGMENIRSPDEENPYQPTTRMDAEFEWQHIPPYAAGKAISFLASSIRTLGGYLASAGVTSYRLAGEHPKLAATVAFAALSELYHKLTSETSIADMPEAATPVTGVTGSYGDVSAKDSAFNVTEKPSTSQANTHSIETTLDPGKDDVSGRLTDEDDFAEFDGDDSLEASPHADPSADPIGIEPAASTGQALDEEATPEPDLRLASVQEEIISILGHADHGNHAEATPTDMAPTPREGGISQAISSPPGGATSPVPVTETPPKTTAPIDYLFNTVVTLPDGHWGTASDQLLGIGRPPGRYVRSVGEPLSARVATGAGGDSQLSTEQRNLALSLHNAALAWADEVAELNGAAWNWLRDGAEPEKVAWVSQFHALKHYTDDIKTLDTLPGILMSQGLGKVGWKGAGPGQDIRVTVSRLPGDAQLSLTTPKDELSLQDFCLNRQWGRQGVSVDFHRAGSPVSADEKAILERFLAGGDCERMAARIEAAYNQKRETIIRARKTKMMLDAVEAKMRGELGGLDTRYRGADIVLDFFRKSPNIEHSTVTYVDTLPGGKKINVELPNHLLLRERSEKEGTQQLVLYRVDLGTYHQFQRQSEFTQYLNEPRAREGVLSTRPATLVDDIVMAAPAQDQQALRALLAQRVENSHQGWSPSANLRLDFYPPELSTDTLDDWARNLVVFEQHLQRGQREVERFRFSPLGTANAELTADLDIRLKRDLTSFHDHAKPAVTARFESALGMPCDPDLITLTYQGKTRKLTDWATHWWQKEGTPPSVVGTGGFILGPKPPPLSEEGNLDEAVGSRSERYDKKILNGMTLNAWKLDATGKRVMDEDMTAELATATNKKYICGTLQGFASSNELADAYMAHVKVFPDTAAGKTFIDVSIDAAKVRMQWMIQAGSIDFATRQALLDAHGRVGADASTELNNVALKGHIIPGLWAIKANGTPHVFVIDGPWGDQLLSETAFRQWLKTPEAEDYIAGRAPYRYHPSLAEEFGLRNTASGLPVSFRQSPGLRQDIKDFIAFKSDNVDEITTSSMERMGEALKIVGAFMVAGVCAVATGGFGIAACAAGTLALVGVGIADGIDAIDRGGTNDAIENFGGALLDAVDVVEATSMAKLLFKAGKKVLNSVGEVTQARKLVRRQGQAFDDTGVVNDVFKSDRALQTLPMIPQQSADGATVYIQGDKTFIKNDAGVLVEKYQDGAGVHRLRDPDSPDAVGPPVEYSNGKWRELDTPPADTRTVPAVERNKALQDAFPEAKALPPERLDEIAILFGTDKHVDPVNPDLANVIATETKQLRIQQMGTEPDSIGLPGDEVVLLRAWADSPKLGKGGSVMLVDVEDTAYVSVAQFGQGNHVTMAVSRGQHGELPSLDAMIEAAGETHVAAALGLSGTPSKPALLAAVKQELSTTIAGSASQSLQTWQGWGRRTQPRSSAANNLCQHYPGLTPTEAEAVVRQGGARGQAEVEQWQFSNINSHVSEMFAARSRRVQRQQLLDGQPLTQASALQLMEHLQALLPGRQWKLTSADNSGGMLLKFDPKIGNAPAGLVRIGAEGSISVPSKSDKVFANWQEAVHDQLTAGEKQSFATPTALREGVIRKMKNTPLAPSCAPSVLLTAGGKRSKRMVNDEITATCQKPSVAVDLNPAQVAARNEAQRQVKTARGLLEVENQKAKADDARMFILRKEIKKEELSQKNKVPTAQELKDLEDMKEELKDLEKTGQAYDKKLHSRNLTYFKTENLRLADKSVAFPPSGNKKFALSSNGNKADPSSPYLDGVPTRVIFEPAENGVPKDIYRNDYPFGAYPVIIEHKNDLIFSVDDLTVALTSGEKKRLNELPEADIRNLPIEKYSRKLQEFFSQSPQGRLPLPANLKILQSGVSYKPMAILPCSEGHVMRSMMDSLTKLDTTVASKVAKGETITDLTGSLILHTEMHPCATSCNNRLADMINLFPNLDVKVYYTFRDNAARNAWLKANPDQQKWPSAKLWLPGTEDGDINL